MEPWKIQAVLAALFAGLTSVLAKSGMTALGADLALGVRTLVVFVLITANIVFLPNQQSVAALRHIPSRDLWMLVLSGATAALSWIFYFCAT